MKALLIGRFQPFHKGHLQAIKKILKEANELAIVIGSSQFKNTGENPFSAEERLEMIRQALKEEMISRYQVFKVPDINNDDFYAAHVMKLVPSFDVVYTGNDLVQRLFKNSGKNVKRISHVRRTSYSGSEIRRRMKEGRRWGHLLPKPVLEYIKAIDGAERVKKS